MNLVIDIGNTFTKLAWFEQGRLVESVRSEGTKWRDYVELFEERPARQAILSSVSSVDPDLRSVLDKKKMHLLVLDSATPLPLTILYHTPETLGHDRIAGAAGARYLFPDSNVLIMDLGTAITIDFVSSEGRYLGGNISPGMQTRYRALHEFTANLPLITKDADFPAFGYDTRTAIVAGVQQGILFELNSYIEEYLGTYPDCAFIITGGDASFFVSKLKRSIFAVPDLVLKGLNHILEYNIKVKT